VEEEVVISGGKISIPIIRRQVEEFLHEETV
jgi:molecular chaperone DnaK (HSP70)